MVVRLRVLVKVVMVVVIILAVWHLTSNFGGNERRRMDLKTFDKKENDGDWHGRDGVGKGPSKGVGVDVDVLERELVEEKDEMPPKIDVRMGDMPPKIDTEKGDMPHQIDVKKGDMPSKTSEAKGDNTPIILLWNNYQGDKSALYNKIFHR